MPTDTLNQILGVLTLASHIGLGIFFILLLIQSYTKKQIPFFGKFVLFLKKNFLAFAFTVATFSTITSLFYSEIAHLPACSMCWYQRIFLFPQVFLLGMALYKKDNHIIDYGILLSLVGALLAIYHILLQNGVKLYTPCSVNTTLVSCSDQLFSYFGYITIPVMSLTAFVMILILLILARQKREKYA